jgi:hypothetical protein
MELKYQFVCDNPRVIMLKNKLLERFFDLINSWEQNTIESNMRWFEGIRTELKEFDESIISVNEANKSRQKINLSELMNQRNKLNRQISTLKKATLGG